MHNLRTVASIHKHSNKVQLPGGSIGRELGGRSSSPWMPYIKNYTASFCCSSQDKDHNKNCWIVTFRFSPLK